MEKQCWARKDKSTLSPRCSCQTHKCSPRCCLNECSIKADVKNRCKLLLRHGALTDGNGPWKHKHTHTHAVQTHKHTNTHTQTPTDTHRHTQTQTQTQIHTQTDTHTHTHTKITRNVKRNKSCCGWWWEDLSLPGVTCPPTRLVPHAAGIQSFRPSVSSLFL